MAATTAAPTAIEANQHSTAKACGNQEIVVSISGISTPSSEISLTHSNEILENTSKEITKISLTNSDRQIAKRKHLRPPVISQLDKFREYARIGTERAQATLTDRAAPYEALSAQGKFAHTYIAPFLSWWQRTTTVQGKCLSTVEVENPDGHAKVENVVNGLSQNYAGFYNLSAQSEQLQHEALEKLPIADASMVPCLLEATEAAIGEVFDAEFCVTTATGYASNYIALPALADNKTMIVLDSDCHNSLLTGAYLAQPGAIRKFAHNDAVSLEKVLADAKGHYENILVVVEGLYSMEGDTPPLAELSKLKDIHDFVLLCDEAHSFYSIGSTGRGCLQYWNESHPDSPVHEDLIDIRTCTLSKAIGGVGGVICGKIKFKPVITNRIESMRGADLQSLSTSQMIQVLWVHGQPTRNARHLHRLADMARFCRAELKKFGIYVYGEEGSHILPIHAGRLTLSTRLSHKLREKRLLGVPLSAPAVPFWQSRIRLNLSASHSDDEINILLDAVIDGCRELAISKVPNATRQKYQYTYHGQMRAQEETEASETFAYISNLIGRAAAEIAQTGTSTPVNQVVRQRGQQARIKHGLGSGGSRFFLTFPPHLELEAMIAKYTSTESCMTFPDAHIGLASTVAALSRPLLGYERHYMVLPHDMPEAVKEGVVIASKKGRPEMVVYRDLGELAGSVKERSDKKRKTYFTVYVRPEDRPLLVKTVSSLHEVCKTRHASTGMTLLLDTPTFVPEAASLRPLLEQQNVQLLIAGSFHKMFRLPGNFVSGSKVLIDELRACSRGYMFTTSTQPFMMEMIKASLEGVLEH